MAIIGFLIVNVIMFVIMLAGLLLIFVAPNFSGGRATATWGLILVGVASLGFYKLHTDWAIYSLTLN